MRSEYYYYFVLSMLILVGALMISGPHFPNSSVSQQTNHDAFIALTIIGILIIIPAAAWLFMIFKSTAWKDYRNRLNRYDSFIKL